MAQSMLLPMFTIEFNDASYYHLFCYPANGPMALQVI